MKKRLKAILILLSILLFIASLFLPVFEVDNEIFGRGKEIIYGYGVLLYGWWAFAGLHFAWLANITWLIALILFLRNKFKWAGYFALITALLTIDGYFFPSDYFAGFYVWNAAMLITPFIYLTKEQSLDAQKS